MTRTKRWLLVVGGAAVVYGGANAVLVGGHRNHVHILLGLESTTAPAEVVKELKRASSIWLKTKGPALRDFAWQVGYGAFSVSHSNRDQVRAYIEAQAQHHAEMTWEEEYRSLLEKHGIEFDDRFYLG